MYRYNKSCVGELALHYCDTEYILTSNTVQYDQYILYLAIRLLGLCAIKHAPKAAGPKYEHQEQRMGLVM